MIELTILGCGNMGRAFAEGLLRSGVVANDTLHLVERRAERRQALIDELACSCTETLTSLGDSRYLLVAIKPQDFPAAAQIIAPLLKADTVVISLLAGVSVEILQRALSGHRAIVRAMPNLPAVIGAGMTAYYCAADMTEKVREDCGRIFDGVGESLELKEERLLNVVTAISGSGPAYLYYFLNAWKVAAQELGLTEDESNKLISQTLTGATWLWSDSAHDEEDLRKRVTSKGGTTEAAMQVLSEHDVASVFRRAITRAAERGAELEKIVKETL